MARRTRAAKAKPKPKAKARAPAPARPAKRSPVPPGFHTVTPYLSVHDGVAAMAFYQKAFGARQLALQTTPDGKVVHGRLQVGDSIVMLSDVFPGATTAAPPTVGTSTVTIHLYVKDVDALWKRATGAGATVIMPLDNQFWGERYGQLVDPFGHHWSLSQRISMSAAEKKRLQQEAYRAFSTAEPAGTDPAPSS